MLQAAASDCIGLVQETSFGTMLRWVLFFGVNCLDYSVHLLHSM